MLYGAGVARKTEEVTIQTTASCFVVFTKSIPKKTLMAEGGKDYYKDAKNVQRAHYKALRPAAPFRGEEIVVARHAETIAEVFPDWMERCKLDESRYHPFDLNMPVRVPRRENVKQAYQADPPISEVGRIMAQIFARELVTRNGVPKVIYTSPSLACVQTAADIRNFIGTDCGHICIEPGLASSQEASSYWMKPAEFNQLKYNVDESYTPQQTNSGDRSMKGRSENMRRMLSKLAEKKGVVLVITDPLGVKLLTSGGNMKEDENEEQMRAKSVNTFPPMSSMIMCHSHKNENDVELSRLFMRPLTTIGECTRPEIEVSAGSGAK
ncbi:Phosphoglycerate mutase family protein [Trichostrongylus colubriformis]|uniref:Phosphoglycerate mutase family protein n=1 Tax=Trichostrongylus colubriformis TaxID=6319 RepID=A0AAN8FK40_TRICO